MSAIREVYDAEQFAAKVAEGAATACFGECVRDYDREELLACLAVALEQYTAARDAHDATRRMEEAFRFHRWP